MGYKRAFGDDEVQVLPYKQQKQLDCSNKVTSFANDVPLKQDISDGNFNKALPPEGLEASFVTDKDVKSVASLSWFTNCTSDSEELNYTTGTFVQLEDSDLSPLDRQSKKQVPIGPDYQANIPEWGLEQYGDDGRLQGVCVVPMPKSDLSEANLKTVGVGRKECKCLDQGSVRCVRSHIDEARAKLKDTFGVEKFVGIGFGEMGEVVSRKWSEDEEQVFHEVVFTNPASLGTNFWNHLAIELPFRTRSEIVSYYFNVFMLQRCAGQNRYSVLDIDSDDDEWHGRDTDSLSVHIMEHDEDEENSEIDSIVEEDNDSFDEDDDDNSDDDDGGFGDDFVLDTGKNQLLGLDYTEYIIGNQDDSGLSFDYQHKVTAMDLCSSAEAEFVTQDEDGPSYIDGFDLLSTYHMMEEFFGPGSGKNKTINEKIFD